MARMSSFSVLKPGFPILLAALFIIHSEAFASTNPGYQGLSYPERGTVEVATFGGARVNTNTGNLILQRTLLFVPGKGLPVHVQLTYNSDHRLISSPFGFGWNLSYNIRYTRDSRGNVIIAWGDGRQDAFTKGGSDFTSPAGVYMALTEPAPGELVLRTKHGI